MFERRLYHHIDWVLIGAVLAICAIGLAMIYSTTGGAGRVYWTQVYALGLGLVAMAVALSIDYRSLADKSHWIYLAMMILLVGVLFFGSVRGGSRRWIDLGFFNLQPSEFAKAVLALMLAKMLGEERRPALTNNDLFIAASLTAVPFLIIARQPDLGTAVTLLPILLVVAYVAGMPMKYIYAMMIVAVLAAPVAYKFALQDYQRERISTFLDPAQDPRGAGYQQIQARITVGSGGVWGKGFMQGTQGQLRFLPVAHNDFIFSVLAEEQGLIGRARRARVVFLRDHARAGRGPAGQGPSRRLSCAGRALVVHVPGHLQHHHVGGSGAGQGTYAAAHELRRLVHDRDAGRFRAHSQRQNAPLHELAMLPRPARSFPHEQGDDHLLERPRNTGGHPRRRPAR